MTDDVEAREAIEAGVAEYEEDRDAGADSYPYDSEPPPRCDRCGDWVADSRIGAPYCERCRWGRHAECPWGSADHQACHAARLGAQALGGASYLIRRCPHRTADHGYPSCPLLYDHTCLSEPLAYRHTPKGIVVLTPTTDDPEHVQVELDVAEARGGELPPSVALYFWQDEVVAAAVFHRGLNDPRHVPWEHIAELIPSGIPSKGYPLDALMKDGSEARIILRFDPHPF